jgi:spermidine synthase
MSLWLEEHHTEGYYVNWKITRVLWHEQTPYQELEIVDTLDFGRALVLDGILQTSERDEFIYHEMMSHVVLAIHPQPRRVLIIGGGDGGVLREVLKYDQIERVDLVEIDRRVVEVCREYLPQIASGFHDARARLYFEDGIDFVKQVKDEYDVVIVDSSDPIGPAVQLFGETFYRDVFQVLKADGMMVSQAESPLFFQDSSRAVYRNMKRVFAHSEIYLACVPTYISGFWAFAIGSKEYDPRSIHSGAFEPEGLKYYTRDVHRAAFVLPPYIKDLLAGS